MDMIEETLRLSPLFKTLSEEEKIKLVQKILLNLGYISDSEEENPPLLS